MASFQRSLFACFRRKVAELFDVFAGLQVWPIPLVARADSRS